MDRGASAKVTSAAPSLRRRDVLCQCAGGVGAVVSCAGMIVSLIAGVAGSVGAVGGSAAGQGGGMAGMSAATGPAPGLLGHPLLVFLNHIALPLLLASVALMLAGVVRAGWRALSLVAAGSVLLLATMRPVSPVTLASLLGGGFVLVFTGYAAAWRGGQARRSGTAH